MSGWCKPCILTIRLTKRFCTCTINAETQCNIFGEFMNSVLHSKPFAAVCLYLQKPYKCFLFFFLKKKEKKEIYHICILGFGKSELRVMKQKLPYISLVLKTLLWGVCVLLFENEHRDFHTRLCTTKPNTNLVFYIMCPWVRLTQTRQALNVLSISSFLWLDFFFPCSKPLQNNKCYFHHIFVCVY